MMDFPIAWRMEGMPDGRVVPVPPGSLSATFAPDMPKIPFTHAVPAGALPIRAAFHLCMGATTDVPAAHHVPMKGGARSGTRLLPGTSAP